MLKILQVGFPDNIWNESLNPKRIIPMMKKEEIDCNSEGELLEKDKINLRNELEIVGRNLSIRDLDDWRNVTVRLFLENGGRKIIASSASSSVNRRRRRQLQ